MRVTFQKRYRAHKNGDVAAQRRQLPEEERSRGEREREREREGREQREKERNINLQKGVGFFSMGIIVILKSQLGYFCKIRFYNKEKTPIFKKPQFVLYYCRVQARFITRPGPARYGSGKYCKFVSRWYKALLNLFFFFWS